MLYFVIKFFEWSAATIPLLGWIYLRIHERVVVQEAIAANIKKGDKVLHMGCGSLPYTALILAQRCGARVTAIDNDPSAVAKARLVFKKHGAAQLATAFCLDGLEVTPGDFDIIILSLGVRPKDLILQKMLQEARRGTRIVVRTPKLWGRFYSAEITNQISGDVIIRHRTISPRSSIVHIVA